MSTENRKNEVTDATTTVFEFRGREFEVPLDYNAWPLALHEAMEAAEDIPVIRAALGPVQWKVIQSMGLTTPGIRELSSAVAVALGFKSPGESPASSD